VIAATLALALVSCGSPEGDYQPEPDRGSDPPLSPEANADVALHIDATDLACSGSGEFEADVSDYSFHQLRTIARLKPHGVFRSTGARPDYDPITDLEDFDGETMIQVLERLAHMNSDCDHAKRLGDLAEELRSAPR